QRDIQGSDKVHREVAHEIEVVGEVMPTDKVQVTDMDIGGGRGSLLTTLLAAYPSIEKGILFDQPSVIEEARSLLGPPADGRLELVGGDFFTALPSGADVYIMKWILHDWNDAACINLLTNCRHAMLPIAACRPPS